MEIGVVVHGPGIIDSGYALKIIDLLSNYGNVHCRLGGTMGRTAVIDAALEDKIDISLKLLPSESLELFNRANFDVIFLLNYGKSSLTGQVFGYKTFTHYFKKISNEDYLATNHKPLYDSKIPVIQIERPGEEDGSIISWNVVLNKQLKKENKNKGRLGLFKKDMVEALTFDFEDLFYGIADELNLNRVDPEEVVSRYFSENIESNDDNYVNKLISSLDYYDESKSYTYRKVHGASPGENIFLNGIVVGYAHSEDIILIAEDGILLEIDGGEIKPHGVEKLGPVNLNNVIVKTGLLRKSDDVTPRILDKGAIYVGDSERNSISDENSGESSFKVGFVDHAAYDIYRFKNFDLVVTIGDDTSLVASDILYRFDIPIVGITDGDLDKVVEKGFVNEKSTIIEVASGFDDIVGHNIFEEVFESNQILEVPFSEDYDDVDKFKLIMLDIVKAHILDSVKEVVPTFIEKDYNFNEINSYSKNLGHGDELLQEESIENESIGEIDDSVIISSESLEDDSPSFEHEEIGEDSIGDSIENSIEDNALEENSDEGEKSFAELVEEISASYEEDSEGSDLSDASEDVGVGFESDASLENVDLESDASLENVDLESENESNDAFDARYDDAIEDVPSDEFVEEDIIVIEDVPSGEFVEEDMVVIEDVPSGEFVEEDIIYVDSDVENLDDDIIYVDSDVENLDDDIIYVDSNVDDLDDDVIYVESGEEGIIEENVVYVDEDGNEIVFEEGVIYVDSEGNEITFDNENGISSVSDDDFVVLEEDSEIDPEALEKYNDILGEYVDGFEDSLDEEFSKVNESSKDSDDEEFSDGDN